jgi:hypothetical protein
MPPNKTSPACGALRFIGESGGRSPTEHEFLPPPDGGLFRVMGGSVEALQGRLALNLEGPQARLAVVWSP